MTVVTMVVRLDVYSLLYGLFLGVLLLLSRRRCAAVWPFYAVLLMVVLLVQYLFCLGLPHGFCWGLSLVLLVVLFHSVVFGIYDTNLLTDKPTDEEHLVMQNGMCACAWLKPHV